MNKKIILISSLMMSSPLLAGNQVVVVGPDCPETSIQTVINNLSNVEIRLAHTGNHVFREHLQLSGSSDVLIKGGYDSCANAADDTLGTSKTTISGDVVDDDGVGEDTVVKITGNGAIELSGLVITEGNAVDLAHTAGGVSVIDYAGTLTLSNTIIEDNIGFLGGGIGIKSSGGFVTTLQVENDVFISNNESFLAGGGLYCDGTNNEALHEIVFSENSINNGVFGNTAAGDGGGIHLNACNMEMHTGRYVAEDVNDHRGITKNTAGNHGGGIYMAGGSEVLLTAKDDQLVNISSNTADSDGVGVDGLGGGIYATGLNTIFRGENIFVEKNEARIGGGLAFTDLATGSVERALGEGGCWNANHCNLFEENTSLFFGGAISVQTQASIEANHTYFKSNAAGDGSVLFLEVGAEFDSEGNIYAFNQSDGVSGDSVFVVLDGSKFVSVHDTIANNVGSGTVFATPNLGGGVTIEVSSSIIHDESSGDILGVIPGNANVEFKCMIVHESASLQQGNIVEQILQDDPQFKDRVNGDFHINSLSPAIDLCAITQDALTDIDGEERGFDDPAFEGEPDLFADAGADETYENDIIFADGFEASFN